MTNRHTATKLASLLALALAMSGCDERPITPTDAGTMGTDAGPMGTDAGPMGMDAGPMDAGPMGDDAGPDTDAGDTDAGDTDGGMIDAGDTDGGTTDTDAGPGTDAGGMDAGTPTDAGPSTCTPDGDLGSMLGASVSSGSTVGAGNDSMASCGSSSASADLAFTWTAPTDGSFIFDTRGSDFDTTIHVHAGSDCARMELDCNDDARGDGTSALQLDLTAGTMVTVVVDGYGTTEEGNYVLSIEEYACPDTDLVSVTGDAVATGTTVGETNEVAPSCDYFGSGTGDATFSWTAPSTGMWTFDTFGSDFDTVLSVHTGASCDAATEVECNDDVATGSSTRSRVDMMLTAGDTVTLAIDGFDIGDEGNYVLSINPTPTVTSEAGACANATDDDRDGDVDCADSDCVTEPRCSETGDECGNSTDDDGDGDVDCADSDCLRRAPCDGCPDTDLGMAIGMGVGTVDTTGGTSRRAGSCGGSGPDATFAFTAPSTGTYTFDTAGSAIDTTLYVLAGSCDGAELACDNDDATLSPQSRVTIDLGADEMVIIVVDGYASAEGMITLNISNTAMTYGPPTTAGDLVINEIFQNPSGTTEANREWFEVYNTTTATLNLNGCRVFDDGTDSFTIAGDVLIHPGQYFTFGGRLVTFTPSYEYSGFTLGNTDDEIVIECGAPAVTIDRVAYDGGPMFPDPDSASMSLDPSSRDATANDTGANWCPALPTRPYDGVQTGTPGRPNPSCP
ncbi:MAG: lamin tail domain-containing protein [Myxococcales bacterium]|nr:lamin tail domain-containing protein [Myxococcales bacterium]